MNKLKRFARGIWRYRIKWFGKIVWGYISDCYEYTHDIIADDLVVSGVATWKQLNLLGKELKIAAENGLQVRYTETYHSPMDAHMNHSSICKMTEANVGYYIGNSDIVPEDFDDSHEVVGDFDEGTFGVYAVRGIKYE